MMKTDRHGVTEKLLAARRAAYCGGIYFELRVAYISLAAAMEGKLYANGAIADRLHYLDNVERFDTVFAFMVDTYAEPLSPSYLFRIREMIAGKEIPPLKEETETISFYEQLPEPSMKDMTVMHIQLGDKEKEQAIYMQTAALILIKECLRNGYVPPMIDAHVYQNYARAIKLFEINHDLALRFIEEAQALTRERAAFFRIEL